MVQCFHSNETNILSIKELIVTHSEKCYAEQAFYKKSTINSLAKYSKNEKFKINKPKSISRKEWNPIPSFAEWFNFQIALQIIVKSIQSIIGNNLIIYINYYYN